MKVEPFAILSRRGTVISVHLGSDAGFAAANGLVHLKEVFELFGEDQSSSERLVPEGVNAFRGQLRFNRTADLVYVDVRDGRVEWATAVVVARDEKR